MKIDTLADRRNSLAFEVEGLERKREELLDEHGRALAEIDADLYQRRQALAELDEFFAWREQPKRQRKEAAA